MSIEQNEMQDHLQKIHIQLQDLLSGYADNMLDESQNVIIEAHLAGCEACRLDVVRQQLLSRRLNDVPVARMSAELHERLDQALCEEPTVVVPVTQKQNNWLNNFNWLRQTHNPMLKIVSGWSVALILLLVMLLPNLQIINGTHVPMVQDVLSEYRHFSKTTLPVSDDSSSMDAPVSWPSSRVLATWKTTIGGASADAFAVRHGDSIIFQFRVDESVFFHNADVRHAILNKGIYQINEKNLQVMAIPLKQSGLLMVGPAGKLPDVDNLKLVKI